MKLVFFLQVFKEGVPDTGHIADPMVEWVCRCYHGWKGDECQQKAVH